jgi:molecular chaperone GrpE
MPEQEPSISLPEHAAPHAAPAEGQEQHHAADIMPSPQELIKQLELQAQEHHDAWLRAKAEADNVRKRAQADIANAHKYALENFATQLLAVHDSLEAALAADNTSIETLRQGVDLTLRQLDTAFEKFAIKEINPVGEKFDPHKHQAMTTVLSEKAPNTVVHVLQKGYLLHDRILRPALVTVAKSEAS